MNLEPVLIEKLNNKVTMLYENNRQNSSIAGFTGIAESKKLLEDYVELRQNPRIPSILKYTVLSSIAKKYNLYDNNQEPTQITKVVINEIEDSSSGNHNSPISSESLIVGLQIIKSQYPAIYQESAQGLHSIEQAALEAIASSPIPAASTPAPAPTIVTPPTAPTPLPDTVIAEPQSDVTPTQLNTQMPSNVIVIPQQAIWILGLLITGLLSGILYGLWSSNNQSYSTSNNSQSQAVSPVSGNQAAPIATKQNTPIATQQQKTPANISQDESLSIVKRFLASKRQIFAPPYNQSIGAEIMTGKAYKDNIKGPSSDGTGESSLEWLRNNGYYYQYGIQQVESVKAFQAAGDNAVIELQLLEEANLYQSNGSLYKSKSGVEERTVRYSIVKENGVVKISDYNVIGKSKRRI
jgi:ARC6-like, IMS domain